MALIAGIDVAKWAVGLGFFVGSFILANIFLAVIDRLLRPILKKAEAKLYEYLAQNLAGPVKLFFVLVGFFLALQTAAPQFSLFGKDLNQVFVLAVILVLGHIIARALNAFMQWYSWEMVTSERGRVGDVFPIARKLVMIAVYFITLAVFLGNLGVEIGPILAGLGVAGLAVALALQDSLKNFFAGLYLLADKPVQVGDFIALDSDGSDVRGKVSEIGWRATRIQTDLNHVYIIPNEKLAASVIVNYNKGAGVKNVMVTVGIDYGQNVKKALDVLESAGQKVARESDLADPDSKTEVRVNNFLDSTVELALIVGVRHYADKPHLAGELRQAILEKFGKEGIDIPSPIRTVRLESAPYIESGLVTETTHTKPGKKRSKKTKPTNGH